MSKKYNYQSKSFAKFRERERGERLRKIYDLFKANFKIESKDFTEQQIDYLMNEFYYKGSVCVLKDKVGRPLVCPFAPTTFNNEDFPVNVTFVNHRAIPGLFPDSMEGVNMEDCVIGYIRPERTSNIYDIVCHQVEKIVNISVIIEINLFAQKLPFFIAVDPADETNMKVIVTKLFNDEAVVYGKLNDLKKLQTFEGGVFNIDKLRQERESAINELLTQLGIDNNNQEKKAQLLSDEVNSNNDEIKKSADVYLGRLKVFSKNIKDVLGYDITFSWNGEYNEEMEEEDNEDLRDEE